LLFYGFKQKDSNKSIQTKAFKRQLRNIYFLKGKALFFSSKSMIAHSAIFIAVVLLRKTTEAQSMICFQESPYSILWIQSMIAHSAIFIAIVLLRKTTEAQSMICRRQSPYSFSANQ